VVVELSHKELSLLLYALEAGEAARPESPSCEEACPVVEEFDNLFGGGLVLPEKKLAHHLNTHMREALIDCGMFEMIGAARGGAAGELSFDEQAKLQQANERLKDWRCEMKIESGDLQLLTQALSRLPHSAWIAMPRTMWRLRKKLRGK
jgi:hypothetical protein